LQGTAISSFLSYQLSQGGQTSALVPGQSIAINPTAVGQTTNFSIQFTNQNTAPVTINTIEVGGAGFSFTNGPFLPLTLQPQQSQSITISYAPTVIGAPTGRLLIGTDTFILGSTLTVPVALPSYQFTGATTGNQPYQQPAIGLSLSAAYPLDIQGTLTLSTATNSYATDPAVQFSSGGKTVAFTIPAGTLQAIFPLGAAQINYQTGTVAGTIVFTPSFADDAGQNLTPANPTVLQVDIPAEAPTVLSASIGSVTTTGFTVTVTGFSTTRSLDHVTLHFTGASGVTLPATDVPIDISASASVWFESASSQSLGGLFSVQIPFTFSVNGSVTSTALISKYISAISVSATNSVGTSAVVQISQL
jgi:hypothetical protein